ncbi:MAG: ECF-type sigma factor [Planctomycetota bacterium]
MSDVTRILNAIERGEPQATEELLPLVYEELRLLAVRKMSQELFSGRRSKNGTAGGTSSRRQPRQ